MTHRAKSILWLAMVCLIYLVASSPLLHADVYSEAEAYKNAGQNDKAIEVYSKAIQSEPNKALNYYLRGSLYSDTNKFDQAIADYTKAIQINANNPSYYNNRGFAYYKKNDYNKAIEDYNKAIQLGPQEATYYTNRGRAYLGKGDYNKAITDFEASLKIAPNNNDTKKLLADAKAKKAGPTSTTTTTTTTAEPTNTTADEIPQVTPERPVAQKDSSSSGLWIWLIIILIILAVIIYLLIRSKKNMAWNLFKSDKFTCPYCYGEHSAMECGLKCSYSVNGKPDIKCSKGTVEKFDDSHGYDWIPQAHKKSCLQCTDAVKKLFCLSIDKEIPIDFLSMKSLPIALLGAKASGKSNYIGVIINEIRRTMSGPFNCSLSMACSEESQKNYKDLYYKPLYENKKTVDATSQGEIPPLIFPLRFMDKKDNITNMAALTFYDTAGENLDNQAEMGKFARYIANSKGIILLLDPLQVPEIRDNLQKNGFTALPEQNTDTYEVLSRITQVIRGSKNIKGKIEIPLALVFTKIDVLEQYNVLPPDSCLRDESLHVQQGIFVNSDFENTNMEMKRLIDRYAAGLETSLKEFKHYSIFGVTALGANPSGNSLSATIKPRRVLDPLLWLLAINNYIKWPNRSK